MIKNIIAIIAALLLFDFVCFWMWILSGQTPITEVYAGAITANIIRILII